MTSALSMNQSASLLSRLHSTANEFSRANHAFLFLRMCKLCKPVGTGCQWQTVTPANVPGFDLVNSLMSSVEITCSTLNDALVLQCPMPVMHKCIVIGDRIIINVYGKSSYKGIMET